MGTFCQRFKKIVRGVFPLGGAKGKTLTSNSGEVGLDRGLANDAWGTPNQSLRRTGLSATIFYLLTYL